MNYKKIALFFLLLFSSQEISPMQWLLDKHPIISCLITTTFIGSIIIIVNQLLSITGKFILKNRYSGMLARFFIAIGGSTITLQHAYDEINYYPWSTLKKIDPQKECALLTFLIDLGINPNIKYDNGSILTRACHYNDAQLVQKILNAGADPNDQNLKYIPPIKENSRIHLDMGGIPYSTTLNDSAGPLVIAFLHNNFEIIKILTTHNAQPLLPYNGNKSQPLLSPIVLIIKREYTLFNHLLDYTMQPTYSLCYTKYILITCITNIKDIQKYISTILIAIMAHPSNFREYINNFIKLQPKASQAELSSLINSHQQPTHSYKMVKPQTVYDEIILIRNRTNKFFPTNNFPIFNGCKAGQYRNETDMYIKIFHTNEDEKDFNNKISSLDITNISTLLEEKYFDFSYALKTQERHNYY